MMLAQTESAFLVIADITGYTGYLAGVELDHAQDILADLVTTVVNSLRPLFRLAKLEGDAAFVVLMGERVDGSALLDRIEVTYAAFRRRLRDVQSATTCPCDACSRIPQLDLKFVAHHGTVGHQRVAGSEELVGSDVIVVHRLLKNSVTQDLDVRAYAMFTDACLAAMGIEPAALDLAEHRESYEHVGLVTGYVLDLLRAWEAASERTRVMVPEKGARLISRVLPLDPAEAWGYLTSPAERPRWQAGVDRVDEGVHGGRRGVGTTNHCVHGADAVVEEILDWRPYDYLTVRSTLPIPGVPKVMTSIVLRPVEGGTEVTFRVGSPNAGKSRAALIPLREAYAAAVSKSFDALLAELATTAG